MDRTATTITVILKTTNTSTKNFTKYVRFCFIEEQQQVGEETEV